ncbi:MAG TPA: ABC transporter substrate-binding protein [Xanthobacteraceae bacterium]|nr:ABC transporter substrate-binding protein [Xanthobacteraceae bacterium]
MRRREFIALLAGAAASRPLAAIAQQGERVGRIGVLMNNAAEHPEGQPAITAFRQALQQLGWSDGRNMRMDIRWGENDVDRDRKYATELVALTPDVILAAGTLAVTALQRVTRAVPIVFVRVADPIGAGIVNTLARPGGNVTGFMNYEYSLSGKWVEVLKQIEPRLTHAAVVRDAANPAGIAQFGAIRTTASSLGVDVSPIDIRDAGEIERAIADFARSPNGGLIVTPGAGSSVHIAQIVTLAARYKLPAVYSDRFIAARGGLISYGPEGIDQFRHAADYVDRILKGEKAGDLPVQAPTKYQLVINLKTAKALDLTIPQALITTSDEVIE